HLASSSTLRASRMPVLLMLVLRELAVFPRLLMTALPRRSYPTAQDLKFQCVFFVLFLAQLALPCLGRNHSRLRYPHQVHSKRTSACSWLLLLVLVAIVLEWASLVQLLLVCAVHHHAL